MSRKALEVNNLEIVNLVNNAPKNNPDATKGELYEVVAEEYNKRINNTGLPALKPSFIMNYMNKNGLEFEGEFKKGRKKGSKNGEGTSASKGSGKSKQKKTGPAVTHIAVLKTNGSWFATPVIYKPAEGGPTEPERADIIAAIGTTEEALDSFVVVPLEHSESLITLEGAAAEEEPDEAGDPIPDEYLEINEDTGEIEEEEDDQGEYEEEEEEDDFEDDFDEEEEDEEYVDSLEDREQAYARLEENVTERGRLV